MAFRAISKGYSLLSFHHNVVASLMFTDTWGSCYVMCSVGDKALLEPRVNNGNLI